MPRIRIDITGEPGEDQTLLQKILGGCTCGVLLLFFIGCMGAMLQSGPSPEQSTSTDHPNDQVSSRDPYASFSDTEQEYLSTIGQNAIAIGEEMESLAKTMQTNPQFTETWMGGVQYRINNLRDLIEEARTTNPPPRFRSLHSSYLKGLNDIKTGLDFYERGLESENPRSIQTAEYVEEGTRIIERTNGRLNDLKRKIRQRSLGNPWLA